MALENDVQMGLRLPADLQDAVAKRAKDLDRSISWVIRDYLRRGLERDHLLKRKR